MQPAPNTVHEPGDPAAGHVLWKAVARIQREWDFSNAEMAQILHARANTYGYWMQKEALPLGKNLSPDMELVVALIAIYRSLGAMFADPDDQLCWLKSPHPDFSLKTPLGFAKAACENLFHLRLYLDYVRGRGA